MYILTKVKRIFPITKVFQDYLMEIIVKISSNETVSASSDASQIFFIRKGIT